MIFGMGGKNRDSLLSHLDSYDALLGIQFHFEKPGDEGTHPKPGHLGCIVLRIKDCQFKNGTKEVFMPAEFFDPLTKSGFPLLPVFFKIITAIKDERKLVVAVIQKAVNASEVVVEFLKLSAVVLAFMRSDFSGGVIIYSQRVIAKKIFHFYKIHKIWEQLILQ
jgi:hypothetical protein